MSIKQLIHAEIERLPDRKLQQVWQFIESLQESERGSDEPLLDLRGSLSGSAITGQEIERELYGQGGPVS